MEPKRDRTMRYLGIVALFCVVCVVYLGRLFYIQIAGRQNTYETDQTTRTVNVQAVRGEIYDRNGVKLVENRYTYDLVLSYGSFAALTPVQKNDVLLQLAEAEDACEASDLRPRVYSPFRGQYPYLSYTEEATDSETVEGYRLSRVAQSGGWREIPTAEQLVEYYEETYELLYTDSEGRRRYNDREIDTLIRFYYDMDAKSFRNNGEYIFATGITLDDVANGGLMTYVKEKSLSSVSFNGYVERVYLYPGYASHILGSVGPIYAEEWDYYDAQGYQMNAIVGKDGCESAFEEYLHGIDGQLKITEDANGNVLSVETVREPVAGSDIRLTIDIDLQIAAEDGLKNNVQTVSQNAYVVTEGMECDAGAAVVIDPETFELLAIASYPTYNLATFNQDYAALQEDPAEPLRNRALNEGYAPGSTLKLGMAVMGLMEGKVTVDEIIACNGKYKGTVGCSTYRQNHRGGLSLSDAISCSCNSYFCELGDRVGIEKMEAYLAAWGLGESTGLELGGAEGVLAGPTYRGEIQHSEPWKDGMTWMAAIGQSDHKMTPIQLATYTATLCNGGTRYAARLLHSVYRFGSSEPDEVGVSEILDQTPIPSDVRAALRESMEQMVSDPANYTVRRNLGLTKLPENVVVGGKTGTAQVDGSACDNALFVCEASTSSDRADIVIAVVLESGAHGYNAAMTAGAILNEFYGE